MNQPHGNQPIQETGRAAIEATAAMILIHGRGATAVSILELADHLPHPNMRYFAPQAANNSWYPNSFLAPIEQNEPGITSGLAVIGNLISKINALGIPSNRIIIGGFSQGACLASEYVARNPQRYGGLLVFSGGVIGPLGMERNDEGDLDGTPIFIGCSDVDAHIPVERVHETAEIFNKMGATVNKVVYPQMGHTIIQDEIDQAMRVVESLE